MPATRRIAPTPTPTPATDTDTDTDTAPQGAHAATLGMAATGYAGPVARKAGSYHAAL